MYHQKIRHLVHSTGKKAMYHGRRHWKRILLSFIAIGFVFLGIIAIWISTFQMPDLNSFEARKVAQSTKIYDRTGKILLYDVHEGTKRTEIPFDNISRNLKNATVAIEDAEFYQHRGIQLKSIFRAILANITAGGYSQGGSTITQQVVKNSLLTTEKTISRKLKEWVLSLKIERILTKEQILSLYLNEAPYGGNIYGVEEACRTFFGKSSSEVSLAEAAYIAAIPKAPTYYSPSGQNKDKLNDRQRLVLSKMLENKFITQDEYDSAKKEVVQFQPPAIYGIRAPHFVEFIKQYLVDRYGEEAVRENGYKVITTLNYDLQTKAEDIIKKDTPDMLTKFNASNAAGVAIDPKTGQILVMVGSKDYFDKTIDGNFNVALAERQPGSTFKPFVYATVFNKGYTPDTVVFDVQTEFQSSCTPQGEQATSSINNSVSTSSADACYMPQNYDEQFKGPMNLRSALAESRNIPAIKVLYLAGIRDSIATAKSMGITSLNDPDRYGLTLVLGGGEVSLLEEVSAYGVFANNGVRLPYTGILSIEDSVGNIVEQYTPKPQTALNEESALKINDILSDDDAKIPAYGYHSVMYYPGRKVASKTGTTNDSKDAWILGYTPSVVFGMWAGNNDNTPMIKKVAGLIVSPTWHEIMNEILKTVPNETFKKPQPVDQTIKPILRGVWQGGETYLIDKISGKLATDLTPPETKVEVAIPNIHSILYWIDKNNPTGPVPLSPANDSQFNNWEFGVQEWLKYNLPASIIKPASYDDVHTNANKPKINILVPILNSVYNVDDRVSVYSTINSRYPISRVDFYLNDLFVGSSTATPFSITFVPSSFGVSSGDNQLRVEVTDSVYNRSEAITNLKIK
ncbi:MAG: transglycosylase domain-containing protein [Candidatus Paceibacterota bacterium]|jgi:penicillin-binding protein 1C